MSRDPRLLDYDSLKSVIVHDPSTSYWLVSAIQSLEERDPLDAEDDANTLAELARKRSQEILDAAHRK